MSLPAVNWRYIGSSAFGTASVANVLDAFYALGLSVTYADGTTRTPGTDSAWTWQRYQNVSVTEAIHGNPPTNTLGLRVILAGAATLPIPSPTMAVPDVALNNILLANVVKNAGQWNAWNAASPFTSGQTFGYWRVWPTSAGVGIVRLYESRESVFVVIETSTGTAYGAILGAILDSESTDTVSDSESDGKLYGIITSGTNANISGTMNTSPQFLDHSTNPSWNHAGIFTPNGSSLLTMSRRSVNAAATSTTSFKSRSGKYYRIPIDYRATAFAPNDFELGRLRDICMFCDSKLGQKHISGATTIGYLFSGSSVADTDCFILVH